MNKHDLTKEIRKLSDLLSLYQNAYYMQNKPLVSDREYDSLFDKLSALEKENPELYKRQFSLYLSAGINPKELSKLFEQVKEKIEQSFGG